MKRRLVAALALSQALSLPAQQGDDDGNGAGVVMPGAKPPTEEQLRMNRIIKRLENGLPYPGQHHKSYSSLGILCRYSDSIIAGRITDTWKEDKDGKRSDNAQSVWVEKIEIAVKTNILGKVPERSIKLSDPRAGCYSSAKRGEAAIVFLSYRRIASLLTETGYDEGFIPRPAGPAAARKGQAKDLYLLGQDRGVISFDGEEELNEYLIVVAGYLEHLPHRETDPDRYYAFLRGLLKTQNPRIREDARCDIQHLVRHPPLGFNVEQVLNDDAVDDGIKDYVHYLLHNGKLKEDVMDEP